VFAKHRIVAVVEEHSLIGGAGSAVLEWGNTQGVDLSKLVRFGGPDRFLTGCGHQRDARALVGLTPAEISSRILGRLN
jgi:deoxyxylulose-5-phosphate synthase